MEFKGILPQIKNVLDIFIKHLREDEKSKKLLEILLAIEKISYLIIL